MEKKYPLHLPQSAFPMKARLPETEPKWVLFWKNNKVYHKIINKTQDKVFFSFLDGPPYANGRLHMGHALNKVLKDIVVKYQNLSGRHSPFIPTWDCHGLPIELAVLKKLRKQDGGPLSRKTIREHCRKEALYWVDGQKTGFERLGVLADWEKPLLTLSPEYEAEEMRALSRIAEKGLLYRGKKPVYWCFALKTAISSSEVEYREHKSPSIYVKFPFSELPKKWALPEANKACSLVIWTTTPWTLPANQAIALRSGFVYAVFDTEKEYLILAEDQKEDFEKKTHIKLKKVLSFKGAQLENKKARHPFMDQDSLIIMGEHVSKEEGTGCVHTAPGHGMDDFIVGKKYKLPVLMPVDEKGCFTSEVPEWKDVHVFKANPLIIEKLKQKACLLAENEITHNYPYNPRSSSPLIFRATDQWFIRFDDPTYPVREKALSAINNSVQFQPLWGKPRLKAMIQASPDWCLSRQRHWGVPIPVFYCTKCGHSLMDFALMRSIADQMEKTGEGIEYWFSRSVEELIPKGMVCPKCQGRVFKKGEDILDVWFDSGIIHHVFDKLYGNRTFPADIYLEGNDQHRGWFQTSLNSSMCQTGKTPFKALITHCFVNDAKGQKMSKSKGNVLNLQNLIQQKGAEIVRLWVCSEDYSQDIMVSEESFARVSETYRRFRNTFRFMLGNLFGFEPEKDQVAFADMRAVDKWILGRLALLIQKSRDNYEHFLFHKIYQDLNVFFTTDLSALYLDILKDRLYTFKKKGQERRSAQSALYLLLKNLVSLMSPMTSFLSEEVYQYLPGLKKESVFLEDFPLPLAEWKQKQIKKTFACFLKIREMAYLQMEDMRKKQLIGSSLEVKVKVLAPPHSLEPLKDLTDDLREFLIVSQVVLESGPERKTEVTKMEGEKCHRCWNYSPSLNKEALCPKCVQNLP